MSDISEKSKYEASPDFVTRRIMDETVLVPYATRASELNGMITFSGAGSELWERLSEEPQDIESLTSYLAKEYGVQKEMLRLDVEDFLKEALKKDVVIVS